MSPHKPVLPRNDLALSYGRVIERDKRKRKFYESGRDWSAFGAAFCTSLLVTKFGKMQQWTDEATQTFNKGEINPDWTLKQHIDFEQMMGLCVTFLIFYVAGVLVSLLLGYLLYDLKSDLRRLKNWVRQKWQND